MGKNRDDSASEKTKDDWRCDGWNEPVRDQMNATKAMTLRERLIWLENATKTARFLRNAPIGEPPPYARKNPLVVAETPAPYREKKSPQW